MSNDKTTEQPIPEAINYWVRVEASNQWEKKGMYSVNERNVFVEGCEAMYRHLLSLPHPPVGEAGWIDIHQDPEPYQSILVTNGSTVHAGGYYAENGKFCLNDGVEFEGGGKCCDLEENYVGWMPSPVGPAHKDSTKKPPSTPSRAREISPVLRIRQRITDMLWQSKKEWAISDEHDRYSAGYDDALLELSKFMKQIPPTPAHEVKEQIATITKQRDNLRMALAELMADVRNAPKEFQRLVNHDMLRASEAIAMCSPPAEPVKDSPVEREQRDAETLYTYYSVEIENMPLDWDTTICESLDDVRDMLQFLDVYLDDDTIQAKVTIKGIGMTAAAFDQWKEENLEPVAHSEQPTPSPSCGKPWNIILSSGCSCGTSIQYKPPMGERVVCSPNAKTECTCLHGPTDTNPNCKYPDCVYPQDVPDTNSEIQKEMADEKLQQAHADIRYWKEQYERLRFPQ